VARNQACVTSRTMHKFENPDDKAEQSNVTRLPRLRPASHRSFPGVAVCVSGTCSDQALVRRTVESVIDQDYPGSIVLMVPEGTTPDRRWIRQDADRSRRVILSPRADAAVELDCNTAFAIALELRPRLEFVALLKCGEVAPPQWLSFLMKAQQEFDADLVAGPVKAVFDEAPSDWMLSGRFFDRFGIQRGPIPRIPAADNLLIRADVIRSCLPQVFVPDPVPHESEWIDFAYRVEALGFASICANDAVVFDAVPKSRMTKEWVIAKEYDKALATTRAQSHYKASHLADTSRRLHACGLFVSGLVTGGWGLFDEARLLRARLMLARAQGMMAREISGGSRKKDAA
jgi:hypothetical protein